MGSVVVPSPDLWLAIFDPTLDLSQALDSGWSTLNLINANSLNSINLDLNLRQPADKKLPPSYYYGMLLSLRSVSRADIKRSPINLHTAISEHCMRHERKLSGTVSHHCTHAIYDSRSKNYCPKPSHDLDRKLIYYETKLHLEDSVVLT